MYYSKNNVQIIIVQGGEFLMKNNKVQNMKTEIANEFGVNLGPDATSRQNGSVGGEITKRLVSQAMANQSK